MNTFHHGDLDKSARLQRALMAIKASGEKGMTGMDLWHECQALNPGTTASEINACLAKSQTGGRIVCEYQGKSESGAKVYRYFYRRINKK